MKNTKKALFTSVLALVLCLSMLIGTTFAWFTDTDTIAVSNVVSGTLDIEIVDEQGNEKTTPLAFVNAKGSKDILWEPGATFRTEGFQIKNVGSLWLKYKVVINNTEVSYNKLNEAITFYLVDAQGNKVELANMKDIALAPNGGLNEEGLMYIEGRMDENAGNEYQGLTLSGVSITVNAAQYTSEKDMTDETYDKTATYDTVVFANSQADLSNALAAAPTQGNTIVNLPAGDYTLPTKDMQNKDIVISGDANTVVDLSNAPLSHTQAASGAVVTLEGVTVNFNATKNYQGLAHTEKVIFKDCVINGKFCLYSDAEFINCTFNNSADYSVWTWGAQNVTFTGCTFNSGGKALLVYTDTTADVTVNVTLNDCVFNDDNTLNTVKAAVEVGSNPKSATTVYNITMTDCDVNGFAINDEGINTGTTSYGNKNSMDADHLKVTIN